MTPFRVSIAAAIAALILLLVIFELIRSRRLQERYALLWLLTGLVIFVLAHLAEPAELGSRSGRDRVSALGAVHARLVLHHARACCTTRR